MYQEITQCRICGNQQLVDVVDLGKQSLSGIFPSCHTDSVPVAPLTLTKCMKVADNDDTCGLVQLKHTYDLTQLYGAHYGYRSSLNSDMVKHLQGKVKKIISIAEPSKNDVVIDIGSNDATTLKFYPADQYQLIGIGPTGNFFKDYYPKHIQLIADFFNLTSLRNAIGNKKAKIITSFAMFYDLENPLAFMQDIYDTLADDGIWCFEQSYLPAMLKMNSFDTMCHEHFEYYHLDPIQWMCNKVGLKIIDIEFNEVNGGSISLIAAKQSSRFAVNDKILKKVLADEHEAKLSELEPYHAFAKRINQIKLAIQQFFQQTQINGERVYGLGASTKGNVLLQFVGITTNDIPVIAEVNNDKFGKYTPGTKIPIGTQEQLLSEKPDYLFVLPWHFKDFFLSSDKFKDFKLVFPLPELTIVDPTKDVKRDLAS